MPVKISFDTAAVAAKIRSSCGEVLKEMKPEFLDGCNEFCPEDTGILINSSEIHSHALELFGETELRLIWSTPYARLLYFGIIMVDPKTGAAGFQNEDGDWFSRKGIKKIPSVPVREFHYSKNGACKLWCEKAREVYGEQWCNMFAAKLKERLK